MHEQTQDQEPRSPIFSVSYTPSLLLRCQGCVEIDLETHRIIPSAHTVSFLGGGTVPVLIIQKVMALTQHKML